MNRKLAWIVIVVFLCISIGGQAEDSEPEEEQNAWSSSLGILLPGDIRKLEYGNPGPRFEGRSRGRSVGSRDSGNIQPFGRERSAHGRALFREWKSPQNGFGEDGRVCWDQRREA